MKLEYIQDDRTLNKAVLLREADVYLSIAKNLITKDGVQFWHIIFLLLQSIVHLLANYILSILETYMCHETEKNQDGELTNYRRYMVSYHLT